MVVGGTALERIDVPVARRQQRQRATRGPGGRRVAPGGVRALGRRAPLAATSSATGRDEAGDDGDEKRRQDRGDADRSAKEHDTEALMLVVASSLPSVVLDVTVFNQTSHRVSWVTVLVRVAVAAVDARVVVPRQDQITSRHVCHCTIATDQQQNWCET